MSKKENKVLRFPSAPLKADYQRVQSTYTVREIKQLFGTVGVLIGYPADAVDLILNATSLGLQASDASPLDETKFPFKKARAVYDMIYRPAESRLLKAAKTEGCRTANGLSMLLYQGAKALEIWSGKPAPLKIMRTALVKNVYGK